MIPIQVECRSGYAYIDRPAAIHWEKNRLEIARILQRWRTPSGWKFLIQTTNEQIFEISYDVSLDSWFGQQAG